MKKHLVIILFLVVLLCLQVLAFSAEPGNRIIIGKLSEYPVNTIKFIPQHKLIIFSDKYGIYAMSAKCTHKGCLLSFKKDKDIFACPCHGAQFSKDGSVARGPAKDALAWYSIKINEKKELIVDMGQVVHVGTKYKFIDPSP